MLHQCVYIGLYIYYTYVKEMNNIWGMSTVEIKDMLLSQIYILKMSCENSEGKKKKLEFSFFLSFFFFAKLKLYKSTYC